MSGARVRAHVVSNAGNSVKLRGALSWLPGSDETDEKIVGEAAEKHLGDKEDVGGQSGLQHDGHVGGVEEPDRVGTAHAALAGGFDGNFDAEPLEVDDGAEDKDGGDKIHDIGQILAVESFLERKL